MIEHGIQIASLCMMLVITINFFIHKRLPLRSTRFFTCFIVFGLFNIIVEFFTLYTITHLDTVPAWFNRFVHQLFIGSIDIIVMMLFLYIDSRARKQKKYSKKELIIRIIPIIITVLLIIFGDLEYYVGLDGYYSYGFMANTIYTFVVIYIVLSIIFIIIYNKRFTKYEKIMILLAISSWVIITIIQYFNPTWLLSSLAIVLMTQFIYMSFENSDKFLADGKGLVFDRNAFEIMIEEFIEKNKFFYICNVTLVNSESLSSIIGVEESQKLFESYVENNLCNLNGKCFYSKDKTVSIVFEKKNDYDKFVSLKLNNTYDYNYTNYKLVLNRRNIEFNKEYESFAEVVKELDKVVDKISGYKDNKIYSISFDDIYYIEAVDNQTFIYTKNSFYESKEKLYQIESSLNENFIRCSKSMICNYKKIVSIEKEKNSRLRANLSNGETIIVSRGYTKELKNIV